MKKFMITLLYFIAASGATACDPGTPQATAEPERPGTVIPETPGGTDDGTKLLITVGNTVFPATLADNATARAFGAMLPMTVNMGEHNGNEKFYYLPQSLPNAPSRPGTIDTGDLMLWSSDCLVLFYKSFGSSYSYTRIGRIDDPQGLESALGYGNVTVEFTMINE